VLIAASTAITVMGVVAVMAAHRDADVATARFNWFAGLPDPVSGRVSQVMAVLTVVLVVLAAVNVIITGWATAVDARQPSALSRALGGTRGQVSAGLSVAQVLPVLPGAVLGMPLGVLLFAVANGTDQMLVPPASWLTALLFGTLAAVAGLTFIPSWLAARTRVSAILQSEAA
jgi:putative ABC transport system permease protein